MCWQVLCSMLMLCMLWVQWQVLGKKCFLVILLGLLRCCMILLLFRLVRVCFSLFCLVSVLCIWWKFQFLIRVRLYCIILFLCQSFSRLVFFIFGKRWYLLLCRVWFGRLKCQQRCSQNVLWSIFFCFRCVSMLFGVEFEEMFSRCFLVNCRGCFSVCCCCYVVRLMQRLMNNRLFFSSISSLCIKVRNLGCCEVGFVVYGLVC